MRVSDAFGMASQSLRANKLRSALTLIGIVIGIVAIVSVMSLVEGTSLYVSTSVANLGSNTFTIDKFGLITDFKAYREALKRNKDLTLDDMEAVKAGTPLAEGVGAMVFGGTKVKAGELEMKGVGLMGATANMVTIDTKQVETGRYPSQFDIEHKRNVCFIGSDIAKKLFPQLDPLGKTLKVDGLPFDIIGVAKEIGSSVGQPQDIFVVIPISTYQKIYGDNDSVQIYVRGRQDVTMDDIKDQARLVLRARHHLKFNQEDDFGVTSAESYTNLFNQITGLLASVGVGVAGMSLVVAGIVIMNIMLVSVTERTREIGVRKSLGAKRTDILWQFLLESILISTVGGLVGLISSYLITKLIGAVTPLPMSMPLIAPILAIVTSSVIGLIFGIYPAWKAAKLDPITALRQE